MWRLVNKFWMIPLYRIGLLPLIGFKNSFLILSTIGNKTGKKRTVALSVRKIDENIFVFAARGKNTNWLKNHFANPSLTKIKYGFKSYNPDLVIVNNIENKQTTMEKYLIKHPRWAKLGIGWNKKLDDPKGQLIRTYLEKIEIVKIIL